MALLLEHWKPIVGLYKNYEISNLGTVRRLRTSGRHRKGLILKQRMNEGCPYVLLRRKKKLRFSYIHALVAEHFHGKRPVGKNINHQDGNKLNPRASNLTYMTQQENVLHAYRTGLNKRCFKSYEGTSYV